MEPGDLYIISAPSGSGKTTICRRLLSEVEGLDLSISYTTRPRKEGEVDGKDYHFINDEEFDKMIDSKAFLEQATVYGHRYGTGREAVSAVTSRGRDVLLEIDVQGGRAVKDLVPEAVSVAIFPPGWGVLRQRLLRRGRDSREEIEARLKAASQEIHGLLAYDYLVVNDTLGKAVTRVGWIIRACRLRRRRAREALETLLKDTEGDTIWHE